MNSGGTHSDASDTLWLDLDFAPADGGAPVSGSLRVPATWLQALLARTDADPRPPIDPGHWRQLPTVATIAIPAPPLTRADIQSLRPGDVIVVGHVKMPPLHANAVGLRWPVRSGPDGWRIDGATELQIFFEIMIPQVMSTILVVWTTITITVLKVFDIVMAMTGGQWDTSVLANLMYDWMFRGGGDYGRSSTLAMVLMLAVIPVMAFNIRRFRAEEAQR